MKKLKFVLPCASVLMSLCLAAGIVAMGGSFKVAFAADDSTDSTTTSTWDGTSTDDSWVTEGTTDGDVTTYTISSAAQLAYLAQYVNGGNSLSGDVVNLTVNIDLAGYTWTPIGTASLVNNDTSNGEVTDTYPFKGTFNGNGCTISNLKNTSGDDFMGLFGHINTATIEDVIIDTVTLTGSYGIGAVVGWADLADESLDNRSTITGCTVQGTIEIFGYYCVGGILGCGEKSTVTDCDVTATEDSGSYVKGEFKDYKKDEISHEGDNIGGVVGYLGVTQNTDLVSQLYNINVSNLEVSGFRDVGGILGSTDIEGYNSQFTITTSGTGTTTVTNCTVKINKDSVYSDLFEDSLFVGAVLGSTYYDMTIANVTIEDVTVGYYNKSCVYDGDENKGFYGGVNTDNEDADDVVITLTNCTGSATLEKV